MNPNADDVALANIHPATQILVWCLLVAILHLLTPDNLLMAGGLALSAGFVLSRHKFVQLVRRTRWILISLWVIYAYSTPGQALVHELGMFSPSVEGLQEGGMQLIRLMAALAGLAILLGRLHRQQLMVGLYSLFVPLQWLGLSRERMTVRLTLTLQYAEAAMLRQTRTWNEVLHDLLEQPDKAGERKNEDRVMLLPMHYFTVFDALLLLGAAFLLWVSM